MKDNFFSKEYCDRCHKKLTIRMMSFLNTQCICEECAEKEETHPRYKEAKERELKEIKKGNYNYEGILNTKF